MLIQICVGSSCHIKGAPKIIELLKKAVEEKGFLGVLGGGLSASAVVISAVLCMSFIAALITKSKQK